MHSSGQQSLTHWGRVTHICVSKLTIIGSDNGLVPCRHQAIIWTNAGIQLAGPLGTNFSDILIEIDTVSVKRMHLKMLSGKWQPFCLGLNVLTSLVLFKLPQNHSVQIELISNIATWTGTKLWIMTWLWQFALIYGQLRRPAQLTDFPRKYSCWPRQSVPAWISNWWEGWDLALRRLTLWPHWEIEQHFQMFAHLVVSAIWKSFCEIVLS